MAAHGLSVRRPFFARATAPAALTVHNAFNKTQQTAALFAGVVPAMDGGNHSNTTHQSII
jgi:hypothetical protein